MKLPSKERFLSLGVVITLAAVLVVLAALQYRWTREISEADRTRMQSNLHMALMNMRQELYREFTGICNASMQPDGGPASYQDPINYIQRYQEWSRATQHAPLVEDVFLWQNAAGNHPQLLRLNLTAGQLEPENWPADMNSLQARLQTMSGVFRSAFNNRKLAGAFRDLHAKMHGAHGHWPRGEHRFPGPGNVCQVDENIPALVRPVIHRRSGDNKPMGESLPGLDWIVVKLNGKFLREHVIPEIANQYFNGPDGLTYQLAIIGGDEPGRLIYSSDSQFGKQDAATADQTLNVFGPPRGRHLTAEMFAPMGAIHNDGPPAPSRHPGEFGLPGPQGLDPIRYSENQEDWQLIARNRKGPLEAVVAGMRRRNLALSFGVLLLLAASMGMIIVASQRAQKLARLQMDFVTAISHELRTPLAVICSAADNLADGLVEGKEQLAKYGNAIKNQGQQLNQLVEQILLFAATRQSRNLYNLRPLQASEIVAVALNNTTGLIQAEQVIVEQHIEPNLPEVVGDLSAFSQCLQNLITNAVKYGAEKRWIGIRARLSAGRRANEIHISVEDKGLGIEPDELPHIFEPFYRSPSVTAAQIHGTGLGLPLAKSMAEAMGARLTVSSASGKGSIFTLHVPVPCTSAEKNSVQISEAAGQRYS